MEYMVNMKTMMLQVLNKHNYHIETTKNFILASFQQNSENKFENAHYSERTQWIVYELGSLHIFPENLPCS